MRWNPGAVFVPSAIVGAVSGVAGSVVTFAVARGLAVTSVSGEFGVASVGVAAGLLVDLVLGTVLTGIVAVAIGHGLFGRRETAVSAWQAVRPRIWALFGAALLGNVAVAVAWLVAVGLAVTVGTAVAMGGQTAGGVLAGIAIGGTGSVLAAIFWIRWMVALPAVVLENAGPVRGLLRSWRLVRGNWWHVLGITLFTLLIIGVVSALIGLPFELAGTFARGALGGSVVAGVVVSIGVIIARAATTSVMACVIVLLYTDLRMRREGMDIATRAGLDPAGPARPDRGPRPGPPPGTPPGTLPPGPSVPGPSPSTVTREW
jgi:hypothetical protein